MRFRRNHSFESPLKPLGSIPANDDFDLDHALGKKQVPPLIPPLDLPPVLSQEALPWVSSCPWPLLIGPAPPLVSRGLERGNKGREQWERVYFCCLGALAYFFLGESFCLSSLSICMVGQAGRRGQGEKSRGDLHQGRASSMSGHVLREERAGNLELWLSAFPEKGFLGERRGSKPAKTLLQTPRRPCVYCGVG